MLHHRHYRATVAACVAIAGLLVALVPAPSANATDMGDSCYKTYAKIWWPNTVGINWPDDLQTVAQVGADYWELYKYYTGSGGLIPVRHDGTLFSHNIEADWSWLNTSDDNWGYGVCNLGVFVMNSRMEAEFRQDLTLFKSAVAHELGHSLGLAHAGAHDSWDGNTPIMATCRSATGFSQDDALAANALGNHTGGYWNATANSSFENNALFWGKHSTTTSWYSGGVDGTARYISMTSSGTSSYIYSTSRLTDNNGHDIKWLQARANYRRSYPGDSGYVKVVLDVGKYNYPNGETCGFPDFYGYDGVEANINAGSLSTSWTWWYPKSCYPGVDWGYCTASGLKPSGADVFDARVIVYNRMKSPNGSYTSVGLDRVRVMVDY